MSKMFYSNMYHFYISCGFILCMLKTANYLKKAEKLIIYKIIYLRNEELVKKLHYLTIFPFYWRRENKDSKLTSFLLLWWDKEIGEKEKRKILFPFWWYFSSERYTSYTLFPLFTFGSSSDKREGHIIITPLFWNIYKEESKFSCILPFWWSIGKGDYKKTKILFPFYWKFQTKTSSKIILFPLYYYRSRGVYYRKWSILYPFFQYIKENNRKEYYFGWPLIIYQKDIDYCYFSFFPIIWYSYKPNRKYFGLIPLFFYSEKSNNKYFSILWPLYTHKKINNYYTSNNVIWKTIFYDDYYNGDYEFRLCYYLFYRVKLKGEREHGFMPFYSSYNGKDGSKSFSLLLYFFNYHKKKLKKVDDYYEEVNIFWFIRILSNRDYLRKKYGKSILKEL